MMLDLNNLLDYGNKKLFYKTKNIGSNLIFAQRSAEKWRVDGFIDQFVAGSKDMGKTAYSLYNLYACYGNWTDALNHLVFDPKTILELFDVVNDLDVKVPMICVDDAATHLAKSTWYEEDTLNFSKLYNVVRSVASSVIMNAPSEKVPSSISNDIKYITKIKYVIPQFKIKKILDDMSHKSYHVWNNRVIKAKEMKLPNPYSWRKAILYHKVVYPSGKIIIASDHDVDVFPQHYPNEVHEPYKVLRRATVKKLINQCLHPELTDKKSQGRPIENIEVSKTIYHTFKYLQKTNGVTKSSAWKDMGLPNRGKLRYHIDKYEAYLQKQQIETQV